MSKPQPEQHQPLTREQISKALEERRALASMAVPPAEPAGQASPDTPVGPGVVRYVEHPRPVAPPAPAVDPTSLLDRTAKLAALIGALALPAGVAVASYSAPSPFGGGIPPGALLNPLAFVLGSESADAASDGRFAAAFLLLLVHLWTRWPPLPFAAGLAADLAEVTMRPSSMVDLTGEDALRMQKLLDALEDLDDVQAVFHNAELES